MLLLSALRNFASLALCAASLSTGSAMADPLNIQATLVPKEQIKLDFKDGSGHFVLMVKREGEAAGTGLLDGAQIVESWRVNSSPLAAFPA